MRILPWPLLLAALLLPAVADAQMRGKRFGDQPGGNVRQLDHDVKATGLVPVFPAGLACDAIASPYGSRTRHDGTPRREDRNGGLHGGMDLTLREGTPLVAAAGGTVVAKGEGGLLEGFYVWMRHAPADTGQRWWAYVKYQHLVTAAPVELGQRVEAGQEVARSGLTGTVGPAYGPEGYPHLHMTLFIAPGDAPPAAEGSAMPPKGARIADPLLLYTPPATDPAAAADLPEADKRVPIPVALPGNVTQPAGSRVVWPTRCATDRR